MMMTLHFGEREIILFSWWKTGSFAGIAVSMLVTFLLCIVYELIKSFRFYLAIAQKNKINQRQAEAAITNSNNSGTDNVSEDFQNFSPVLSFRGFSKKFLTPFRLGQAALYGIQVVIAYTLMLIVMTFNVNLILAVVAGEAVGYFLFTGSPLIEGQLADCC